MMVDIMQTDDLITEHACNRMVNLTGLQNGWIRQVSPLIKTSTHTHKWFQASLLVAVFLGAAIAELPVAITTPPLEATGSYSFPS